VELTATADTGYTFANWWGDASGSTNPFSMTMNGDKSVTANYTLNAYLLTVLLAGNGSGTVTNLPAGIDCIATCSFNFDYNTTVTLAATPATGSTFSGWSGEGCTGTGPCVITMDAAKTVTANFTLNIYLLTVIPAGNGSGVVISSPTGIDCGETCSANYYYNIIVTLTATPATGSTFTGWSGGGCTGTSTCDVTMDIAKSVIANFTPTIYRIYLPRVFR
jgi:uncharacterized repeat protein (TIGR02543 family)